MNFLETKSRGWVCPSDRELTLRAKLQSGWSSKTNQDPTVTNISELEQAAIAQVLERAKKIDLIEEDRNRRLTERLEKIKKQACGIGRKNCVLCNDQPGFFRRFHTCKDCQNSVCSKCSIDTHELDTDEAIWLCKICSEHREFLKKTNLWTHLTHGQ